MTLTVQILATGAAKKKSPGSLYQLFLEQWHILFWHPGRTIDFRLFSPGKQFANCLNTLQLFELFQGFGCVFAVCIQFGAGDFLQFFSLRTKNKKVPDLQRRILASLSHETVRAWHRAGHVWRRGCLPQDVSRCYGLKFYTCDDPGRLPWSTLQMFCMHHGGCHLVAQALLRISISIFCDVVGEEENHSAWKRNKNLGESWLEE